MFSAVTKTVLPPDYDNNPTQLNYGVAVTDVDGDGDLEMFVAGWDKEGGRQALKVTLIQALWTLNLLRPLALYRALQALQFFFHYTQLEQLINLWVISNSKVEAKMEVHCHFPS